MQITVRTWHSVRIEGENGFQVQTFLKRVELPQSAINRIAEWAK